MKCFIAVNQKKLRNWEKQNLWNNFKKFTDELNSYGTKYVYRVFLYWDDSFSHIFFNWKFFCLFCQPLGTLRISNTVIDKILLNKWRFALRKWSLLKKMLTVLHGFFFQNGFRQLGHFFKAQGNAARIFQAAGKFCKNFPWRVTEFSMFF